MTWGPIASKSAAGMATNYSAQVFTLRFIADPVECLGRLNSAEFRLVPESLYADELSKAPDKVSVVLRSLGDLDRVALAWSAPLSSCTDSLRQMCEATM